MDNMSLDDLNAPTCWAVTGKKAKENSTLSGTRVDCNAGGPGDVLDDERYNTAEDVVRAFNAPNNARGQNISILIATETNDPNKADLDYGQGIDYNSVERIDLLSPPETYARFLQLRGRVPRLCSHRRVPRQ